LIKYFECRDKGIIEKLLHINEEMEKKIRDESVFYANQDKIPKLSFEIDNYNEWFYAVKSCIRKTTYHNYFEKKDVNMSKNYESELYDIMEKSIEEGTKKYLQLEEVNKNPRKLIKEIVRAKHRLRSNKINALLNYINNHKYHKKDDIHQHLEILFLLFDELAKLKKVLTEQEKLEKILNTLPREFAMNIKKITRNSEQLGLSILYIIKYAKIWDDLGTANIALDERTFQNVSDIVNSTSLSEDRDKEEEEEEEEDPQKNDQRINQSNQESSNQDDSQNQEDNNKISENDTVNTAQENLPKEESADAIKVTDQNIQEAETNEVVISERSIPDTEADNIVNEENIPDTETDNIVNKKNISDSETDNIVHEKSSPDSKIDKKDNEDSVTPDTETKTDKIILEKSIPETDTESEIEIEESQRKLNKTFSMGNLFLYLIFILVLECLVYFKYDILKLFS